MRTAAGGFFSLYIMIEADVLNGCSDGFLPPRAAILGDLEVVGLSVLSFLPLSSGGATI